MRTGETVTGEQVCEGGGRGLTGTQAEDRPGHEQLGEAGDTRAPIASGVRGATARLWTSGPQNGESTHFRCSEPPDCHHRCSGPRQTLKYLLRKGSRGLRNDPQVNEGVSPSLGHPPA